jgi:membrane-associated phospholipid phosphatase
MNSLDVAVRLYVNSPAPKVCIPDWAFENVSGDFVFDPRATCPHGTQIHAPASPFTMPTDSGLYQYFGVLWSLIPAVILFLNMTLVVVSILYALRISCRGGGTSAEKVRAFLHRVKFPLILYIFFPLTTGQVVVRAEHGGIASPRPPTSCLMSCGMPSGHNVIVWGISMLLLMDLMRLQPKPKLKRYIMMLLFAITVPMPLARVATNDHTVTQVFAGVMIGILTATMYYLLVEKLSHRLCGEFHGIAWPVYFGWLQFGWLPLPDNDASKDEELREGFLA